MLIARLAGAASLALALYYLAFFAQRQEQPTLLQIALLGGAAALFFSVRAPSAGRRAMTWSIGGVLLAAAVFALMDRDSHSVSDTLNRVVPTCALLAAIVVKLGYEPTASTSADRLGTSRSN